MAYAIILSFLQQPFLSFKAVALLHMPCLVPKYFSGCEKGTWQEFKTKSPQRYFFLPGDSWLLVRNKV